ncbi:hypothetical protein [Hymenobacter psychrotolerans]|uniref:Uncharacterized protein n=1 Tax=Hymenobacter psychrotolerans DSM 18569 TaxID=1121959 RepID=A0A1M7CVY8_9BACT|nr:hypothetical protein [Hymenobacter psychrotolerans]SHL71384.1 hypothetical protein SAMN02746009_03256 [Hymenobacter psychrotolerans DSM 18569]
MMWHRSALLLTAGLALPAAALAQAAPRQLQTLPSAPTAPTPDTTRRAAPRQLAAPPSLPDSVRQQQQQRATLPPANTTRYAVGLKTGQVYKGFDVTVKQPFIGRPYLVLDEQQRFDLDQVRYFEDESGFYVRTTLPGRSKREATLRRDRVGRISLYSITSTQYAGNGMGGFGPYGGYGRYGGFGGYPYGGYGGPMYRTTKTEYFSKDNGPIEDLSLRNLLLATADNPTATNLLLQARQYQTYTTISYVAAGGLLVAGLVSSLNQNSSGPAISPLMYASLPFMVVPLVLGSKSQNNVRQAINLYNRGQ